MNQTLEMVLRQTATLTPDELAASLGRARARNLPLWDFLVLERQIPEDALANAFSKALNLPRVDIDATPVDAAALEAVAGWLAHKHTCLPIRFAGKALVLAMANPLDSTAIHDVQFASSRHVKPVVASRTDILTGIRRWYASTARARVEADPPPEPEEACVFTVESAPAEQTRASDASTAVELCSQIMSDAITLGASDVHIEAGASGDPRPPAHRWRAARIPAHSGLDARGAAVADQDPGRSWTSPSTVCRRTDGSSTRSSISGSMCASRRCRRNSAKRRFSGSSDRPTRRRWSALGFSDGEVTLLDEALYQPQGLILVTGPTGGGKSTTLHSMLARRQSKEINIVTIEDPIEYQVAGATQVQVNVKAGVTFASCLRAILRQDPDVIMVGEIRDKETAEIAFHAALTGHLVLSTLHTNSSIGAIARLIELGVKPTMLTAATNLIMAQRLARRICAKCREPYTPAAEGLRKLQLEATGWDVPARAGMRGLRVHRILRARRHLRDPSPDAGTQGTREHELNRAEADTFDQQRRRAVSARRRPGQSAGGPDDD